jgi:hypothetical protein
MKKTKSAVLLRDHDTNVDKSDEEEVPSQPEGTKTSYLKVCNAFAEPQSGICQQCNRSAVEEAQAPRVLGLAPVREAHGAVQGHGSDACILRGKSDQHRCPAFCTI